MWRTDADDLREFEPDPSRELNESSNPEPQMHRLKTQTIERNGLVSFKEFENIGKRRIVVQAAKRVKEGTMAPIRASMGDRRMNASTSRHNTTRESPRAESAL